MSLPDNDNFFDRENFFAHIYTTHARKIINDYIARDKKERIRRAKIERDIIRLTHENDDLPVFHKVVCSSMIMHTDTFEPFWSEAKLAYNLPGKSLERLVPKYSLINGILRPQEEGDNEENDDSSTLSALENAAPKGQNNNGNASANSSAKGKKKTNSGKQTKPIQPQPANKKNAPKKPGRKASTAISTTPKTKAKQPQTTGRPRGRPPAQSKPKTTSTTRPKPSGGGVKKNVSAKKDITVAPPESSPPPPPRGPLNPREAFEECMARVQDEDNLRGPTSDEEETDDDDDGEI